MNYLEKMVLDFIGSLSYQCSMSKNRPVETWKPPECGWWKVNHDATFDSGRATVVMVVKDDAGLLIEACLELIGCNSAFEVEAKDVERAVLYASSKGWRNFIFSSDALVVVEEALFHIKPRG